MIVFCRKMKIRLCCLFLISAFLLSGNIVRAETIVDTVPEDQTTALKPEEATTQTEQEGQGWNKERTAYYKDGEKLKGIQKINGQLYFFDKKGTLYKKKGLNTIGENKYYFNKDYSLKTGVGTVKGKKYYFSKETGARYEKSGIQKVDGKYYCFSNKYILKNGWQRDKAGKRYYFDKKKYNALIGWNYVGKYKFYFDNKGRLCQDVRNRLSKKEKSSYEINVNRTACCVTVYAKDKKKNKYCIPVVSFVCSPGNGTPVGTFRIRDKLRWHELMGPCWGQWCEHITDRVLFHSVYYNSPYNNKSLSVSAYNKLGTMASHGCVRLTAGDAKWIYDNCKVGTKVSIYNNASDPGPFDKPKAKKLNSGHTWDPTDPTV